MDAVVKTEQTATETRREFFELEASIPAVRADDALAGRVGDDRAAAKLEANLPNLRAERDAFAASVEP